MMVAKQKSLKKCSKKGCKGTATTHKYCRLHYIAFAQRKHERKEVAKEKLLDQYVAALTRKYPDRYLEIIKKDLSSADQFRKTLKDLHISSEPDDDLMKEYQSLLEKIDNKE